MKLPTDEMARLDLTDAHEKALEALEQLGRLARIADDPDAYTVAELQAAMDAAKYLEAYWGSGPVALEANGVVAAFVEQVEARRACREHGLVPQAKYDEICAQLEQAKAAQVHFSLDCRVAKPIESNAPPASIGIGDPKPPPPPPPPPTLTAEDLAWAWKNSNMVFELGYEASNKLVAHLNESIALKCQR